MRIVLILMATLLTVAAYAQSKPLSSKEKRARMQADSIDGCYIPKNMEDCFTELGKVLKPEDVEHIKKQESRGGTIEYHFSLGMWLRNNWGLWGGSRLQKYLLDRGLRHPDDMSACILEYYWDWLNGANEGWQKFDREPKK